MEKLKLFELTLINENNEEIYSILLWNDNISKIKELADDMVQYKFLNATKYRIIRK